MPNNQIEKGYDFSTGQLVTADNLDNLAQEATLRRGAISEQPAQTDPIQNTDEILINDVSDVGATKPKKATISQVLNANLNSSFNQVNLTEIATTANLPITTTDGSVVTATGFTYLADNIVTVASPSHGLVQGDYIELTCSDSLFSGRYRVETVPTVNSFTYKVFGAVTTTNGTCTWKKVGSLKTNGNVQIDDDVVVNKNVVVDGNVRIQGNKSLLLPKGTTATRPANPESGEIRYNSTLNRAEIYDGTTWKELGASPFDASGGDIVLEPSNTVVSATFSSANGIDFTVTVAAGHDICMGQIVEIAASNPAYTAYNGEYVVTSIPNLYDVVLKRQEPAAATASGQVCTIRKSGNHKVHIFKNSGTFVVGERDIQEAEVLVVGGGAYGQGTTTQTNSSAGGGGGFVYLHNKKIAANTTYTVSVGLGGVSVGTAGSSSFIGGTESLVATGGTSGNPNAQGSGNGGSSGSGRINNTSYPPKSGRSFNTGGGLSSRFHGLGGSMAETFVQTDLTNNRNPPTPKGFSCFITNIMTSYAVGGQSYYLVPLNLTIPVESMEAMNSVVPDRGFSPAGCGGQYKSGASNNGTKGIVIIRYPYKLQT